MSILSSLRGLIGDHNPLLHFYYKVVAIAAAIRYGFPSQRIRVIAITGTKGKSTVTHITAKILEAAGMKVGVASTIGFQIGDLKWMNTTKQSTQGRFRLQQLIRMMVDDHCDVAILEVTSHALVQSRLWGVNFDTAVLTNIQNDHLEYHGSFENYMYAKGLLFKMLGTNEKKHGIEKTAVLPLEDPNYKYFAQFPKDRELAFGIGSGFLHAEDMVPSAKGVSFTLRVPNGAETIDFKLPGEFNVRNALAAAGAAISCGVNLKAIKKGLEEEFVIPGRLERIEAGQPFNVIVDYAHTEESLERVLELFKPITKGKLWLVFGCTGGGRDTGKRPLMGKVAHKYADMIVVTDDDSYTEDRMTIINNVCEGIPRKEGEGLWKIRDRREAIRLALTMANEGDTVIIAGKGCEPIQILDGKKIEWDDRKVAREILSGAVEVAL